MLGNDFCWFGEGIWDTNVVWGDDANLHCSKHKPKLHQDAYSHYCHDLFDENNSVFTQSEAQEMCRATTRGRALQVSALVLNIVALLLAVFIHFTRTAARTNLLALLSAFSLLISIALLAGLIQLMLVQSPLFGDPHALALGKFNQANYHGFGCVFQSPFVNGLGHLVQSAPLKCIYPGPAILFALACALLQGMGIISLLLVFRQAHKTSRMDKSISSYYSLHGAFMRKLARYPRAEQYLLALLPPLCALGSGALLIAWFYHGMEFVVLVHVRVFDQTVLVLREHAFSFDPVTILHDFWAGRGYLVALVTLVWLDLFPFFKILVWLLFWFVPANEVLRARVFAWLDYLGRWTLVSLFCLCVIALGFIFARTIEFAPLRVEIQVIMARGPGVTWFLIALIWTVGLGNVFLALHSFAKEWEEARRRQQHQNNSTAGGVMNDTPALAQASLLGHLVRSPMLLLFASPSNGNNAQEENEQAHHSLATFIYSPSIKPGELGHATRYRFTRAGRGFLLLCFLALVCGIVGMTHANVLICHRTGVLGDYLIAELDQTRQFSLASLLGMIGRLTGGDGEWDGAVFMQLCFALFALVVPLAHGAAMALLFFANFTLHAQKRCFRLVEFLDAWNALDVFLLAILVAKFGFEPISSGIVPIVIPGMAQVAQDILGRNFHGIFVLLGVLPQTGFSLLLCVVVLQKSLTHFIMELGAVGIAQREQQGQVELEEDGRRELARLSPNALLLVLSPAARYAGVSNHVSFALGLGARLGLMTVT